MAQQDVDNARSEFESSQGALEQAQRDLDDTDVRAPIAGRVGRTLLDVGARVTGAERSADDDRSARSGLRHLPPVVASSSSPGSRTRRRARSCARAVRSAVRVRAARWLGAAARREARVRRAGARRGDRHAGVPRAVRRMRTTCCMPGAFVHVRVVGIAQRARARRAAARGAVGARPAVRLRRRGGGHRAGARCAAGPVGRESLDHRPGAAAPAIA